MISAENFTANRNGIGKGEIASRFEDKILPKFAKFDHLFLANSVLICSVLDVLSISISCLGKS